MTNAAGACQSQTRSHQQGKYQEHSAASGWSMQEAGHDEYSRGGKVIIEVINTPTYFSFPDIFLVYSLVRSHGHFLKRLYYFCCLHVSEGYFRSAVVKWVLSIVFNQQVSSCYVTVVLLQDSTL